MHVHHIKELTQDNVNDYMVSMNPDNLRIVCHECHNKIHERFGYGYGNRKRKFDRDVYIIYGPPLAGKKTYVKDNMEEGDLVIEMDMLYRAVSMGDMYNNPEKLKYNVYNIRNLLIDNVKTRYGKFNRAWVIGGYPNAIDRDRLANELGAETIFINVSKEECISRLKTCNDFRSNQYNKFKSYIEKWFEDYR
ncbi:HNH endonuclease signature motif containing protein (plasmid) [Paraclostridium sordellii]|uniref:HNH endonuclease signature motif containing protein n=1 Tax=Paraclostridium sordellii TaxID=1505 RepID=UPI0030D61C46